MWSMTKETLEIVLAFWLYLESHKSSNFCPGPEFLKNRTSSLDRAGLLGKSPPREEVLVSLDSPCPAALHWLKTFWITRIFSHEKYKRNLKNGQKI